jgi:hypothetical protein
MTTHITAADHAAADAEFARRYPNRNASTYSGFKLWTDILRNIIRARVAA